MTGDHDPGRPRRSRWTPWDTDPPVPDGSGPVRVYCLPHAGGSAGTFLGWVRSREATDLRFVPVELPGRGTRMAERPPGSMDEVVCGVLSVLERRPPEESFLLFGHSMGAHVVYETARRLAATGRPLPRAVVAASCRPPGHPAVIRMQGQSDAALLDTVGELGGIPGEILERRDLLGLLLPAIRADLALVDRYAEQIRPTALPCPVVAFAGAADRHAGPAWTPGWRSTTTAWFGHHVFPGDHFFLHAQVGAVIAELAQVARTAVAGGVA